MIKLMHGADLHLDSPFAGLPADQAAARRAEQRSLLERLSQTCREQDCRLLLLAGDLFDARQVYRDTVDALRDALDACGAQVFIAPGNHDCLCPGSPYLTEAWPDNVHIFKTAAVSSVACEPLGCRVYGAAFLQPHCESLLEGFRAQDDGLVNLMVLHGELDGPQPRYAPIPSADAADSGLDYLALGHIHKTYLPRKAGKTWYGWPGVALGRGFDECGVHGVFHVILDGGGCRAELLPLPGPRYERITVRAGEVLRLPEDSGDVICRLCFTGESEPLDLERLRETLAPRFLALELRDETTPPPALWDSCGDGTLRGLALGALRARYDRAEPAERPAIALAARYVLAALEGREAP